MDSTCNIYSATSETAWLRVTSNWCRRFGEVTHKDIVFTLLAFTLGKKQKYGTNTKAIPMCELKMSLNSFVGFVFPIFLSHIKFTNW